MTVAEEVEEEEWDDEEDETDLEELNGRECLWPDGRHEPEEDPEEWIDGVADGVEEKRFQKMQALENQKVAQKESVTTRTVYDWRKKPYQLAGLISVKR